MPIAAVLALVSTNAWSQTADGGTSEDASAADAAADATVVPPPPDPHDATPPEPPSPVLADEVRIDVSEDVAVVVLPPHGWSPVEGETLEIPDLAQVPDSEVVVQRVFRHAHHHRPRLTSEMFMICVAGPSSEWAPGMESLLFERLNSIANNELGKRMAVASYNAGPIEEALPVFRQSFEATGKAGSDRKEGSVRVLEVDRLDSDRAAVVGKGRHVVGFIAEPDRVLVCSAACVEPLRHRRGVCASTIASFRLDGPLAAEPSPSISGRFVVGLKRRPSALLGAALGLLLTLAGVLAILRGLMLRPSTR